MVATPFPRSLQRAVNGQFSRCERLPPVRALPAMLSHPGTPYRRLVPFQLSERPHLDPSREPERRPQEIWPRQGVPARRHLRRLGHQLRVFCEVAERVELCLFDDDGAETRVDAARGRRLRLARLPARRRARPALRLPGARPVRPRARASGATRPSCCSTPTPRRSTAASTGTSRCSATTSATRTAATTTTRAPHMPSRVVINPFFDWGDDRPPRTPYARDGHLRGARQGPHRRLHPDIPEEHARHLRRRRAPGDHRAPHSARRHRDRADAGAPVRPRHAPARARACATTGATTPSASSRPHNELRRSGQPRPAGAGVQGDGQALHEAGIEVILDVVYNHTAEGNHLGPDAVASAASTTRRTTGSSTTTSATTWTTPAPATA